MKTIVLFSLGLFVVLACRAQSDTPPVKYLLSFSAGANVPVSSFKGGYITDNLIGYSSKTHYAGISFAYFLNSHWGAQVDATFSNNPSLKLKSPDFIGSINSQYQNNYYVTIGGINNNFRNFGTISTISLGPVYKIERGKFMFMFRPMFGIVEFSTNDARITLKGKGTNELINIKMTSRHSDNGEDINNYFQFTPSITIGHKVNSLVMLNFNVGYSISSIHLAYDDVTDYTGTGKLTSAPYKYHSNIQQLTVGAGISLNVQTIVKFLSTL